MSESFAVLLSYQIVTLGCYDLWLTLMIYLPSAPTVGLQIEDSSWDSSFICEQVIWDRENQRYKARMKDPTPPCIYDEAIFQAKEHFTPKGWVIHHKKSPHDLP